jgi:drug/metabolite transporter (DMT)-like permease
MNQNNKGLIVLSLATLYLAWSSTYLAIRIALEDFPPFFIAGFRYMLVGGGMFLYLKAKGALWPTLREWIGATVIGIFLLMGGTAGTVYAEQWVGSGMAALVLSTSPLLTVLFAMFWKHRPARNEWLGMLLGMAGIVLLNIEGDLRAHPLGAVVLMIASASWSFGSVLSLHVPMPRGMMASAAQMFCGGLIVLMVSWATGETMPSDPSVRSVGAMVWLAVFGSLLGYTAYTYLLTHVRPSLATSYAYVNPVLAVLLGVWIGGEDIARTSMIAMPIILSGVVLVILGQHSQNP